MLRIGLTGGIGSGKTTVSNLFADISIDVIDADEIVHVLSKPNQPCYSAIVERFGREILETDNSINRKMLADRVFNNAEERKALETILHPAVRTTMLATVSTTRSPYIILVIPLLIETGFTDIIDRVLVVQTDQNKRIEWVKQRNGLNDQEIKVIMDTQASDKQRLTIADDVIFNNEDIDSLRKQVKELDIIYRALA